MQALKQKASAPVIFLVLGMIMGTLVGYVTRPAETAALRLGPLSVEVQSKPADLDDLTKNQKQHIATIALIGGVIGLGLGLAFQRGIKL
jgi:hypothetical protein